MITRKKLIDMGFTITTVNSKEFFHYEGFTFTFINGLLSPCNNMSGEYVIGHISLKTMNNLYRFMEESK